MWEYLAVLVLGFWLGVAIFLYVSCCWLDEILDLPSQRNAPPSSAPSGVSGVSEVSGVSGTRPGASGAHVRLQRLVARALHNAAALPPLHHPHHHHHHHHHHQNHTHGVETSTYEDLLASAILNKVIERYQREGGDAAAGSGASGGRSSGIHSASASPSPEPSERSSPRSLRSPHSARTSPSARATRARPTTPPPLVQEDLSDWDEGEATDEAQDEPSEGLRRVPFPEYGGDLVHRADDDERDFDEVSGGDLQAVDGTWEENWLFQKKKIKAVQSVPVPMLVPNSSTEYRALIGDRHADDTTDLSDNVSDAEDDSTQYKSDIKKVLDSKHVIGGKTLIDDGSDFEPDSLTIIEGPDDFDKLVGDEYERNDQTVDDIINEINDNNGAVVETVNVNTCDTLENGKLMLGVDSGPPPKAEFALKEEIHRTALNCNLMELSEAVNTNGHSDDKGSTNTIHHHEREGEYEETVTVPVQRYADSLRRKHFEDVPQVVPTRDTDQDEDLIPGSVAYRERKKWLNYVEMPNNPYSPEAIKKRLSAKSTSSLFDNMINTQTKDLDNETFDDATLREGRVNKYDENIKVVNHNKISLHLNSENINRGEHNRRSKSPSPKVLRDVLTDEVPQYKRYGRDYYIREAKASAGGRKKGSVSDSSSISSLHNMSPSVDSFDREFSSPGLLIKQFNMIATNQQYAKFAGKDQPEKSINTVSNNNAVHGNILIEYDDVNELSLFSAKPVAVDDDTDKRFEEILETAYTLDMTTKHDNMEEPMKSPISVDNSYISSSSMEDSIKIYNVQTGEIMKCKPEDTLSARYEADSYDNIDIADKSISRKSADSPSPAGDTDEGAFSSEETRDPSEISELNDLLAHLPKVKELAKKFFSMDTLNETGTVSEPYSKRRRSKENLLNEARSERPAARHVYMHSLTARSISKEFREELKLSMATPLTAPGGARSAPAPAAPSTAGAPPSAGAAPAPSDADALPEPGAIKTKLAFFESLKHKFTTK